MFCSDEDSLQKLVISPVPRVVSSVSCNLTLLKDKLPGPARALSPPPQLATAPGPGGESGDWRERGESCCELCL